MYQPAELANFALFSFERGLTGLTDDEARTRLVKADGTQMNAISWIVAHASRHWLDARAAPTGEPAPAALKQFASGSTDPAPPSLADALAALELAKGNTDWIAAADEAVMAKPGGGLSPTDTVGTRVMRAVLHTWFHIGEVNSIRQMLGHPEIAFVGSMAGRLEWRPAQDIPIPSR